MDDLITIFSALSEGTRLRILKLLEHGELCVCDIFNALDLSQPKVSFHLNALKEAGLIRDRKQGKWIHYSISDADIFRRFLISSVLERLSDNAVQGDRKRLDIFMKTKERKAAMPRTGRTGCCGR
jgi:ArsR family transcriptional regulator